MPVAIRFDVTSAQLVTGDMVRDIADQAARLPGAHAGCADWVADVISDACAILPSLLASRPELPIASRVRLAVHTAWVESIRRLRLAVPDGLHPAPTNTEDDDALPGSWVLLPAVEDTSARPRPVTHRQGYVAVARLSQPGEATLHPVLRLALAWARLTLRQRAVLEATMDVQPEVPTDHRRNDHHPFRPRTGQVLTMLEPRATPRSRRPLARLGDEQLAAWRAFCAACAEVDAEYGDEAP